MHFDYQGAIFIMKNILLFLVAITIFNSCKVGDKTKIIEGVPVEWKYPSTYQLEDVRDGFTLENDNEFPVTVEIINFNEKETNSMMKYYNNEKLAYKGFRLENVEFEEYQKEWLGSTWRVNYTYKEKNFGLTKLRYTQYILLGRVGNNLIAISIIGANPNKTDRLLNTLYESTLISA